MMNFFKFFCMQCSVYLKPIVRSQRFHRRQVIRRSTKPNDNNKILLRQICTDLIIDTNICIFTNSLSIGNNLQRQLLITYQNDIILTSLSSKIHNYYTRGFVYILVGLLSGFTTSCILHSFNISGSFSAKTFAA